MNAPILSVRDLGKRFGSMTAARDITVSVPAQQTVGVIGSNGAGKTTFINMITGHLRPTNGTIHFEERDITGLPVDIGPGDPEVIGETVQGHPEERLRAVDPGFLDGHPTGADQSLIRNRESGAEDDDVDAVVHTVAGADARRSDGADCRAHECGPRLSAASRQPGLAA